MPDASVSPWALHPPYFFLSYAHTVSEGGAGGDSDREVVDFFHLLCKHLRQMTVIPPEASPGYVDSRMPVGTLWRPNLLDALATCRVFVPLYSPRYFTSTWCGREWGAFQLREAAHGDSGYAFPAIVPVLWTGSANLQPPECASGIQYTDSRLGDDYKEHGIYGLMIVDPSAYRRAAFLLATTIRDIAESTRLNPCDPAILERAENAFGRS
jgi:hypothetical protein